MCYNINGMGACSKCGRNKTPNRGSLCKGCVTRYYKNKRYLRSLQGLCVTCGKNKTSKDRLRCSSCLSQQADNTCSYRRRLKEGGLLCVMCRRRKQLESYTLCPPCFIKKEFLPWLKTSIGCKDCGEHFSKHPEVLEFDHVPSRGVKTANVAALINSLKRLSEELIKCDVVCANCHNIRTTNRGKDSP